MALLVLLTALFAFLSFGFFIVALILNRRAPLNRALAAATLLYGVWAMASCLQFFAANEDQAWFWYRVATIGSILNSPSIIWVFLSFSDLSWQRKVFTTFPFLVLALVMAVANTLYPVWYSGFEFTSMGPVGIPTNPTAWVAFYVVVVFYLWAFVYFCSPSGYSSPRLAWFARFIRNSLIVTVLLYVASLVLEVLFLLPHISGLAYGGVCLAFVYSATRYGLLSPGKAGARLDVLLSIHTPAAYAQLDGTLARINLPFRRLLTDGQDPTHRPLSEFFAEPAPLASAWRLIQAGAEEVPVEGLKTRDGSLLRVVLSADRDRFGDLVGAVVQIQGSEDPVEQLRASGLTNREVAVAVLLGQGLSYQEIADRAFISPGTVRVHCHNILDKVGVKTRAELVRFLTNKQK